MCDATAPSDVRSMSVDPGSIDDQLSSQESWDGVGFDGAAKKKAEGGGGDLAVVGEYSGGGGEGGESTEEMGGDATVEKKSVCDVSPPNGVVHNNYYLSPECDWLIL